jgi:hypothetical protein
MASRGLLRSGVLALLLTTSACGDDSETPPADQGVKLIFDTNADLNDPAHFYDAPYPMNLFRETESGSPDLTGFPNPGKNGAVDGFIANSMEAEGFPVLAVTFFRFTGPLGPRENTDVIPAEPTAPIILINVDSKSPEYGKQLPVVARTLEADPYTAENVLAVAARPGFILRAGTKYGVVVLDSALDAQGAKLAKNDVIEHAKLYREQGENQLGPDIPLTPLWDALDTAGVSTENVVAATVFTTGEVVKNTAEVGDKVLAAYDITIDDLAIDASEDHAELCVLRGNITLPQFQTGERPFGTEGKFTFDADGTPIEQRTEEAPVVIVIPRTPMPTEGYPLILNVHGSCGYSIAMVRPVGDDCLPAEPIGPAFPHALKGMATAGMAMPLNPERYPGATETEYVNANNFAALRDTFRQGTIEARLFLEALTKLQIDPEILAECTGASLSGGATSYRFDASKLAIMGQSMGGMYTNLVGATEPKLRIAVPTGAGGYWPYFILETELQDGQFKAFLPLLLGTQAKLTHLHPALAIAAGALEAADPFVSMPYLARHPLEGHPARPIYEPAGQGDSYFPTTIYDAAALAYGHPQAGNEVWPEMQDALALAGLDGVLSFPLTDNLTSENGDKYTGAVMQFVADGDYDPHAIYSHRDDVKRQYSCFLDSFFKTGVATIPPLSDDWTAACP